MGFASVQKVAPMMPSERLPASANMVKLGLGHVIVEVCHSLQSMGTGGGLLAGVLDGLDEHFVGAAVGIWEAEVKQPAVLGK